MLKESSVKLSFYQNSMGLLFYTCLVHFFSITPLVYAGDKNFDKIHIISDKLVAKVNGRYADFTGNVKVTHSAYVLYADRLMVFYNDSNGKDNFLEQEGSIKKIVATGSVIIIMDERTAVTEKAVYSIKTQALVLSGSGSKVVSGNNSVSGEKITINRGNGRVIVEGGVNKRVEAVFSAGDKGID